jgi:hypothetical protein
MFESLSREMKEIRTRKFHLVDGALPADKRMLVEQSDLPVPPSYKSFVIQFGGTRLYRKLGNYLIEVFPVPRDAESEKGEKLLQFGRVDLSRAFFKEALLVPNQESPVFEWRHDQGLVKTADGFEEWLRVSCEMAKTRFKKDEWKVIERGPLPFNEREKQIVEARRLFQWSVVGISEEGSIQFKVFNGSRISLPYLSIGIRGRLRDNSDFLEGGIWLPVGDIRPGETKIVAKDCYKRFVAPELIEALEQPDPEPEDRDRYWEFKKQ